MESNEIVLYVPECPYCARHHEICEDAELDLIKLGIIEYDNERSNNQNKFEKLTND